MDEGRAIKKVLSDIIKYAPGAEIILVDSSSDSTPKIAKEFSNVKLIRQFPPIGYGPAMTLALRSASKPIIITLDCDNTYPANRIIDLVNKINEGYDLVDASRLERKPLNMPWLNYLANIFFARLASLLFLRNIKDLHSGMRAYKSSLLSSLTWKENGAALPVELLLKPIKLNYKVAILYIDYHLRIGESKMKPLSTSYWTAIRILKVWLHNA